MPDRDEITLRAMRFHPRVGILPHERELAQPLEVDLTVWTRAPRAGASRLVVDYRALYELVARRMEGQLDYLEDVALEIVEAARALEGVVGARAAVRKPHVALPGPLAHAEVVVERGRRA